METSQNPQHQVAPNLSLGVYLMSTYHQDSGANRLRGRAPRTTQLWGDMTSESYMGCTIHMWTIDAYKSSPTVPIVFKTSENWIWEKHHWSWNCYYLQKETQFSTSNQKEQSPSSGGSWYSLVQTSAPSSTLLTLLGLGEPAATDSLQRSSKAARDMGHKQNSSKYILQSQY